MTLQVKQHHDCQTPNMKTGEVEEWTERVGLFMRPILRQRELYESREARWTCPHCDSTWRWSPSFHGYEGTWFAVDRKSYWVEVDE